MATSVTCLQWAWCEDRGDAPPGFARRHLLCVPRGPSPCTWSPSLTSADHWLLDTHFQASWPWLALDSTGSASSYHFALSCPFPAGWVCTPQRLSCEAPTARSYHTPHLCGCCWPQACWPPWQKAAWTASRRACRLSRNSTSRGFEEADLHWAQKSSETTQSACPLFTCLCCDDLSSLLVHLPHVSCIGVDAHS